MVILAPALVGGLVVGGVLVQAWRWGLFRRVDWVAARAQAQEEAYQEMLRATALHPSAPTLRPSPRPTPVVSTRRGKRPSLDEALSQEAQALLEAQALENGALEAMVASWA